MLKRWNSAIYDVDLMLKFLHVILTSLKMDERSQKRRGRKPKRPPSLYIKAIILKEAFKCSLNELVEKGYVPIVKPTKRKPDGFGSKISFLMNRFTDIEALVKDISEL